VRFLDVRIQTSPAVNTSVYVNHGLIQHEIFCKIQEEDLERSIVIGKLDEF
jgi:hypothetical protein